MSETKASLEEAVENKPVASAPDANALAAIRRKRSIVLALALGAFVILVFVVTLTRLGGAGVSGAP